MKQFLVVACALFLSHPSLAVPEGELAAAWDSKVWPYYDDGAHRGFVSGHEGVPLRYVEVPRSDEDVAIVLLPGRGEVHHYYAELVYDLRDLPWSIYILDHRGQGESGRMLSNPHKGHVEDFEWYADDVKTFFDDVVNQRPHKKIILMAHSMGGTIASLFAEAHPEMIDGLILVTPMHQANYKPYTETIAAGIAIANVAQGRQELYAIGQGDPKEPESFEKQHGTSSQARFEIIRTLVDAHPDLRIGGVTYGWAHESVKGARKSRAEAGKATMPVLLFQAGEDETVQPQGQDAFCSRAPNCTKVTFKTSRHNPLRETDDIRTPALDEMKRFTQDVVDGRLQSGCSSTTPPSLVPVLWLVVVLGLRRRSAR